MDITAVMEKKLEILGCHNSQRHWLDDSQGMDNYLSTMVEMSAAVGRMSGVFEYSEGWRVHSHLGFGPEDFNPLRTALGAHIVNREDR